MTLLPGRGTVLHLMLRGTVVALLCGTGPLAAAQTPSPPPETPERFGLGRPATAANIEAIDIDVRPDGEGLPPGRGDVTAGGNVYRRECASCHGVRGEGGTAPRLVGAEPAGLAPFGPEYETWRGDRRDVSLTVGNYWPFSTTLFDYIRRAMPTDAPGSLTADEVYGLTAWILAANGIIDETTQLDAETLADIRMPARDLFVPDDRLGSDEVR